MVGDGKIYVLVNKDLGMSAGKTAAQVAHAVSRLQVGTPKIVIVLEATESQMINLGAYLGSLNIPHSLYIDEGVNEVPPMSLTAMAFGKTKEDFTPDYISGFKLYRGEKSLWQKLTRR